MTWITPQVSNTAPDGTSYDLTGPENAPVVVLIHGLGLCRDVFAGILGAFAGYRVLSYDLYGHGQSAPANQTTTLTTYSDQLAGLLTHLDIPSAHIIGFSIGGMINRRFALDHAAMVLSLVILNSPHDRGDVAQAQVEGRAISARDKGAFATFGAALQRWFTPDHLENGAGPVLVRRWREMVDDDSYAQASWVLANGVVELIGRDGEITKPTLVITCENDPGSTPAMSRDIASEIAGSELLIVPHLKHLGLMEMPKAFTTPILNFIERVKP